MELVGPDFRTFAGNGISMFFGLSLALLAGLAHVFRNWFHLALATSMPFIPLFGYVDNRDLSTRHTVNSGNQFKDSLIAF